MYMCVYICIYIYIYYIYIYPYTYIYIYIYGYIHTYRESKLPAGEALVVGLDAALEAGFLLARRRLCVMIIGLFRVQCRSY